MVRALAVGFMFRISISNHKQTVRAGGRVVSIPPSSEFVEIFFAKINTKIELSLLGHISLPTLSGTTNSAGGDAEHETYCERPYSVVMETMQNPYSKLKFKKIDLQTQYYCSNFFWSEVEG